MGFLSQGLAFTPPASFLATQWTNSTPKKVKLGWDLQFENRSTSCTENLLFKSPGEYLSKLTCQGVTVNSLRKRGRHLIFYKDQYMDVESNGVPLALAMLFSPGEESLQGWIDDAKVTLTYEGSSTKDFTPYYELTWNSKTLRMAQKQRVPIYYSGPFALNGGDRVTITYNDWVKVHQRPERWSPLRGIISKGNKPVVTFSGSQANINLPNRIDSSNFSIETVTSGRKLVRSINVPPSFPSDAIEFLQKHR